MNTCSNNRWVRHWGPPLGRGCCNGDGGYGFGVGDGADYSAQSPYVSGQQYSEGQEYSVPGPDGAPRETMERQPTQPRQMRARPPEEVPTGQPVSMSFQDELGQTVTYTEAVD
jgi:hypothetical protein